MDAGALAQGVQHLVHEHVLRWVGRQAELREFHADVPEVVLQRWGLLQLQAKVLEPTAYQTLYHSNRRLQQGPAETGPVPDGVSLQGCNLHHEFGAQGGALLLPWRRCPPPLLGRPRAR